MPSTDVIPPAQASCPSASPCAGGVFVDAPPLPASAHGHPPVRRLRPVRIDFGRVFPHGRAAAAAGTAATLTLNLFPDVCVRVVRDQATDIGRGQIQWAGRLDGVEDGRVLLVIDGPVVVGTVRFERRVVQISYLGEGVHAVAEIEPSAFPRE